MIANDLKYMFQFLLMAYFLIIAVSVCVFCLLYSTAWGLMTIIVSLPLADRDTRRVNTYWAFMCIAFIGKMLFLPLFTCFVFQKNASFFQGVLGPRKVCFAFRGPPLMPLRECRQPHGHMAWGEKWGLDFGSHLCSAA